MSSLRTPWERHMIIFLILCLWPRIHPHEAKREAKVCLSSCHSHKIICVPQRPKGKIQAAPLQVDTKSMESRLWVDWTSSWVFDIYDWLCGLSQSRTEISFFSLSLKYKQCLHEWTDPLCLHMQSRLSDCSVNSRLAALKVSPTFQIGHVLPLDIRPL